MEKKTLLIIGLIGGIIAAVGVFLPWISVTVGGGGITVTVTANGFDSNQGKVVVLGGVLALIGGLAVLMTTMKGLDYLIPIGGLVALLGCLWYGADVGFGNLSNFGYGLWVALVGAVLALIGTLGVKK